MLSMGMHRVRYGVHLGCQLSLELPVSSVYLSSELIVIDTQTVDDKVSSS